MAKGVRDEMVRVTVSATKKKRASLLWLLWRRWLEHGNVHSVVLDLVGWSTTGAAIKFWGARDIQCPFRRMHRVTSLSPLSSPFISCYYLILIHNLTQVSRSPYSTVDTFTFLI